MDPYLTQIGPFQAARHKGSDHPRLTPKWVKMGVFGPYPQNGSYSHMPAAWIGPLLALDDPNIPYLAIFGGPKRGPKRVDFGARGPKRGQNGVKMTPK